MAIHRTRDVTGTGTGTKDFTVSGIGTPVAAIFLMNSATAGLEYNPHQWIVGFTDGTNHRCGTFSSENNVSTLNTWTKLVNDVPLIHINANTGAIDGVAAFSAFITDGVRLNITDAFPLSYRLTVILFVPEGSGYSVTVGDLTSSGSPTVTPGWRPDQIFCFGASEGLSTGFSAASGTADAGGGFSVGFLDHGVSDVQRCMGWTEDDAFNLALGGNSCHVILSNTEVFSSGESAILATSSTGFSASGSGYVGYLAISYQGNNQHGIGDTASPTSTGDQAITGLGFQPSFVMEVQSSMTAYGTVVDSRKYGWSLGVMVPSNEGVGATDDNALSGRSEGIAPGPSTAANRHPDNVAVRLEDSSITVTATKVSFDANGYTKNFSAVNATARKGVYLAVGPAGHPARRRLAQCDVFEQADESVRVI